MITLRQAHENDAAAIVAFMHKLGEFQNMSAAITVTEENMKNLLRENAGEAVLAFDGTAPVAFAYFCQHSSAFIGHKCLYMDAFFVEEAYRKHGIGKQIMKHMANICKERNYARMEWGCLDWNTNAWNFYTNLGSVPFDILTIHRLSGEKLQELQNRQE